MSNNASRIFIVISLIAAIGLGFMYFNSMTRIGVLESQIDSLEVDISNFVSQTSALQDELNDLASDYRYLDSRYSLLESQYNALSDDYEELSSDYNELDYQYSMYTDLKIGNSLTSYYDYLRYEFGPTGTRSYWRYEEESCKFASRLALHDLHRLYWIEAEEKYGADVGQESYAQAWEVLNKAVSYCSIDYDDSDTEKIKKILEFVNGLIVYESEIDDSIRAPVETLNLKSGDCDDFSVLVATLLEAVDIQAGIGFFENDDIAHAMVLVNLDELDGYLYWYYEDLTYFDFESGNWILIEPQSLIEYQGSEEWFSQWHIYMAVEVDYDKATS